MGATIFLASKFKWYIFGNFPTMWFQMKTILEKRWERLSDIPNPLLECPKITLDTQSENLKSHFWISHLIFYHSWGRDSLLENFVQSNGGHKKERAEFLALGEIDFENILIYCSALSFSTAADAFFSISSSHSGTRRPIFCLLAASALACLQRDHDL